MCCIKNGGPGTLSRTPEKTLIVCLLITHLLSGSDWGSSIPHRPLSTPCPVWNLFNGTIVAPYGPYSRTSKQWWKIDELLYCLYERIMYYEWNILVLNQLTTFTYLKWGGGVHNWILGARQVKSIDLPEGKWPLVGKIKWPDKTWCGYQRSKSAVHQ